MNICFITTKLDISAGGASISLDIMARNLIKSGHGVKILTLEARNGALQELPYQILDIGPSKFPYYIDLRKSLIVRMSELSSWADVYHVFNPWLAPLVMSAKKEFDQPAVLRFNSLSTVCSNRTLINNNCYKSCNASKLFNHSPRSKFERVKRIPEYLFRQNLLLSYVNRFDLIIAVSSGVRSVISDMGADEAKIAVIPNCADPRLKSSNESVKNLFKSNVETLLWAGRLIRAKQPSKVIKMMRLLPDNLNLHILGSGPEKKNLTKI